MPKINKWLGAGLLPWLFSDKKVQSKVGDFFLGGPDEFEKIPSGTPEQEELLNRILSQAMGMGNGGGYDLAQQYYNNFLGPNQEEAYNKFAAPYLQQFQEQVLPRIAERFAGGGALSSSGFGQALGGATSGLQAQLAQMFAALQGQAAQQQYGQYNQLAQTGLGYKPFGYNIKEGGGGLLGPLLAAAGTYFGGPGGGAIGAGIGSGIGSLYKQSRGGGLS